MEHFLKLGFGKHLDVPMPKPRGEFNTFNPAEEVLPEKQKNYKKHNIFRIEKKFPFCSQGLNDLSYNMKDQKRAMGRGLGAILSAESKSNINPATDDRS